MTNKQQVQQPIEAEDPFALTEQNLRKWFLNSYNKHRENIETARKSAKESETEIDPKTLDQLLNNNLYYDEGVVERHLKEILKTTINPKSGKFWDTATLQAAGKLSDGEIDTLRQKHSGQLPPFYYFWSIGRYVDAQHKEWLTGQIMVELIDKNGQGVNKGWKIGYRNELEVTWKYMPSDPRDPSSTQISLPQHNWRYFYPEDSGVRIYEIPYSKEMFFAMLKHTRSQDPTDKVNGVSLTFKKAGASNPMSVKSIEQFTTDNFEEEWAKLTAPPAAKDLANFVQEFKKQNQQQDNKPQAEFLKDFLKEFVAEFRRQSIAEVDENTEHYK